MIKSRRIRWVGTVARMERRGMYVGYWWECQRPQGRPRRRLVDNIKMDVREIGWDGMEWIDLALEWDRRRAFVNTIMNLWVP
jgi:hypothetical protein